MFFRMGIWGRCFDAGSLDSNLEVQKPANFDTFFQPGDHLLDLFFLRGVWVAISGHLSVLKSQGPLVVLGDLLGMSHPTRLCGDYNYNKSL